MNIILLVMSVLFGTGRSIFTKKMSSEALDKRGFYVKQGFLFLSAAVAMLLFDLHAFANMTSLTVVYGIVQGVFVILSQCCYSIALDRGPTSICAMIYSFGFIFPTVSGAIFWDEPFGIVSTIGMVLVIMAIIAAAFSGEKNVKRRKGFLVPNIVAMLSGGALGVGQKMHQSSPDKQNLVAFLILTVLLAAVITFVLALLQPSCKGEKSRNHVYSIPAGVCYGLVSLVNTLLAGRMPSAVVFPILNIGLMMMCLVAGMLLFKEKPNKPQTVSICLGVLAIIVLSFE